METIKNVSISELHSFRNHPFKVETTHRELSFIFEFHVPFFDTLLERIPFACETAC